MSSVEVVHIGEKPPRFRAVRNGLLKILPLLVKFKYITAALSIVVSIGAYTLLWGLPFAAGFVMLLFIHEMGHVTVLRLRGVKSSLPMFIPFVGAYIQMKEMPNDAYEEAQVGLGGPALGMVASAVVAIGAHHYDSKFLYALAFVGFFINLINLIPALPLDGGRAMAAIHPVIWLIGLVGILVYTIFYPNVLGPIIMILGGIELWQRWANRDDAYYKIPIYQKLIIAVAYIGLIMGGIIAMNATIVTGVKI